MEYKITKSKNKSEMDSSRIDSLYSRITDYINTARKNIERTVNIEMVRAYWVIGKEIIEEEQQGKTRAEYGTFILSELSLRLTKELGKGFSISTLKDIRQFYLIYKDSPMFVPKGHTLRGELQTPNSGLSWAHYRELMRITRSEARSFYEIEAIRNRWSSRELQRQIGSLLFDRLSKSRDKEGVLALALKGQEINKPEDAIKEPFVLEFLGIPESHRMTESKLEQALINNLQHFLLELGKGFAFVARQKRLTLDGDHFYTDLVFYHIILKCYIIIDIKTHALTHADLGQMQLYVNYFDLEIKAKDDNPTIGLVLCTSKNDTMVKYTLAEKSKQIFASKYQIHLPTEAELEKELKREIMMLKNNSDEK